MLTKKIYKVALWTLWTNGIQKFLELIFVQIFNKKIISVLPPLADTDNSDVYCP